MNNSPESAMWSTVVQIAVDDAKKNLKELAWFGTRHAKTVIEFAGLDAVAVRDRIRPLAIDAARSRAAAGLSKKSEFPACAGAGITADDSSRHDTKAIKDFVKGGGFW